ncbi:uncharacterized protein IUM83_08741 [Phytophthora cinnamomi]|uniref:uncharacterized protein n=1 Tax=Phytophthora cinnamomi TaxID=4785 RepID=UPI0035594AB4|nr:hypothetical protein IUM83_08741 [Phytophthora cinnamomi]
MEAIHTRVEQLVHGFRFSWELARGTWAAIKSEPGVEEQTIHRDFSAHEIGLAFYRENCVQATVIVALMADTTFVVYPENFGSLVGRKDSASVTLQPGDILFYRGDMVNSAAAYEEQNICLRCFVRVWGVPQSENSSEIAAFASFLCSHCLQSFDAKEEVDEHEQVCPANSNTD